MRQIAYSHTEKFSYEHLDYHEIRYEDEILWLKNHEFTRKKFFRDTMSRQNKEMVGITDFQGTILNSKPGWNNPEGVL